MPIYTSFQFLQSIEDKLSEKIFTNELFTTFAFTTSRLLNFREEQATLSIRFSLQSKGDREEANEGNKTTTSEEMGDGGKIQIQEVPHKGPASAFQFFITLPESATRGHTPMLINDDNTLEREALKVALYYSYYLQESIQDKLKENVFKQLSEAALKQETLKKVDELIPRIEPVKEKEKADEAETDKTEEATKQKEEAKAEA